MKKVYITSILLSAILVSLSVLFSINGDAQHSATFSNCEKKIYVIKSQIKKAEATNNKYKKEGLEISLQKVNEKCNSIL